MPWHSVAARFNTRKSPAGSTASRPPSTALRYFCLGGTDYESHELLICRYIYWRNRNAHNEALRELVKSANVAWRGNRYWPPLAVMG